MTDELSRIRAENRLLRRIVVAMIRAGRELVSDAVFRDHWCETEEALDRIGHGWFDDTDPAIGGSGRRLGSRLLSQAERVRRLATKRDDAWRAMIRYGRHDDACDLQRPSSGACVCGLADEQQRAIAALKDLRNAVPRPPRDPSEDE